MALLWKKEVDITVRSFTKHHVVVVVNYENKESWHFTGFYGEPEAAQRHHSWTLLNRLGGMNHGSVVVILTKCLLMMKKGKVYLEVLLSWPSLAKLLMTVNLIDMGFVGDKFTWTNRRGGNKFIQERLDRCFCFLEWRTRFPDVLVEHLEYEESDHCPMMLNIEKGAKGERHRQDKGLGRVHFEEFWTYQEDFHEVISRNWTDTEAGNAVMKIKRSISQSSASLKH